MKALSEYIPPNAIEGDSLGELQFDEVAFDWSKVAPDEVKHIQKQIHEIIQSNGETLQVKAQNESGNVIVLARQDGDFLAQVTSSGSGVFAFRALGGATIGMSIIRSEAEQHA